MTRPKFDFQQLPDDVQRHVVGLMDGGTRKSLKATSRTMRTLATLDADLEMARWASTVMRMSTSYTDLKLKSLTWACPANWYDWGTIDKTRTQRTLVEEDVDACVDPADFVQLLRSIRSTRLTRTNDTAVTTCSLACATQIPKHLGSGLFVSFGTRHVWTTGGESVEEWSMNVNYGKKHARFGRSRSIEIREVGGATDVQIIINFKHGTYGIHVLAMLLYAWCGPLRRQGSAFLRFFPLRGIQRTPEHDAYEAVVLRFFESCRLEL